MSDPFAAELYRAWCQPIAGQAYGADVGAMVWCGRFLAQEEQAANFQRGSAQLVPRVVAALRAGEPQCDDLEAHQRAMAIAMRAVFHAQELLDISAEREARAKAAPRANGVKGAKGANAPHVERLRDVTQRVMREIESPERTVPTPFPGLNKLLLGGFRDGELIYLGGRPATGKSALASECALEIGGKAGKVLCVSLEMSNEANVRRMLAQAGQLDASSLRSGIGVDWASLTHTAAQLHDRQIWLTSGAATLEAILQALDSLPVRMDLVIVDYVQLMKSPKQQGQRRLEVEAISAGLKRLAVERGVPVLALSSLSRPVTHNGKEQKPTLGSLRESGAMEHDADIALLLHRERDAAETECLVAKNRDGRTGIVQLMFRERWVGFQELTQETLGARHQELFEQESAGV